MEVETSARPDGQWLGPQTPNKTQSLKRTRSMSDLSSPLRSDYSSSSVSGSSPSVSDSSPPVSGPPRSSMSGSPSHSSFVNVSSPTHSTSAKSLTGSCVVVTSSACIITQVRPSVVVGAVTDVLRNDLFKIVPAGKVILIYTTGNNASILLSSLKTIGKLSVKVFRKELTKKTRGIIHGVPEGLSNEELLAELETASGEIVSVRRLGRSHSVQFTMSGSDLPPILTMGYLRFKVRPFFATPIRCFRCQSFGHVSSRCSAEVVCRECAGSHETRDCTETRPKCANCGDAHAASSKQCPKLLEAQERLSRRLKTTATSSNSSSFATATSSSSSSSSSSSDAAASPGPLYSDTVKGIQRDRSRSPPPPLDMTYSPLQEPSPFPAPSSVSDVDEGVLTSFVCFTTAILSLQSIPIRSRAKRICALIGASFNMNVPLDKILVAMSIVS
mgnify:CR=1 FL=1